MTNLRDKLDQARRDLAHAAWHASNDNAQMDAVAAWAQTIRALYADLDPARPDPKPSGYALAGRAKDGSYIFTKSGNLEPRTVTRKGKTKQVTRKTSTKTFLPGYYRRDSEFPDVEVVDIDPAYTGNDLIFSEVQ